MSDPTTGLVTATIAAVAAAMVVVIREVLNFIRQRNGARDVKNLSGSQPISFWTNEFRRVTVEALEQVLKGRGSPVEVLEKMDKGQDALSSQNLRVLDKLDKMIEGYTSNRNIIVDKLDKILEALYRQR